MYCGSVTVQNISGLHARPASEFVARAKGFQSKISIRRMERDKPVGNAKSIIVLLSMGICQGESVEITAEGPDEQEAVAELTALIESGFGED